MLRSLKASFTGSQREEVSKTSTSVTNDRTSIDLSYNKSSLSELPRSYSELDLSSVPPFHNKEAQYFSRRFQASEQKNVSVSTGEWRSYAGSNGRCRPSNVAPSDFMNIGMLGRGDVGHVYLVRKHGASNLMAMKVLSKKDMIQRKKIDRALMEQKILLRLNHPFLVTLHETFQTDTHLYFCMDYCSGGEFFKALQSLPGKRLCEADALFYTAEVVLALEYLHLMGFIYRDLKPENVLLRDSGHIVLSDFDLAKHDAFGHPTLQKGLFRKGVPRLNTRSCVQTLRTNSFVGTEEYIAPEIVLGQHHGSEVDWWTLGIFIYEMLYATTPFKGSSRNKTFQNILTGSVWFPEAIILPSSPKAQSLPPKLSSGCKSLIRTLLNKDPRGRLGYRAGAGDVRAHKWFKDINFALIRNTKPPLKPECCEIFECSPGKSLEWLKEKKRKQPNLSGDSTDPFDQFCSVTTWMFWLLLSITHLGLSRYLFILFTKPQQWHKSWMLNDPEEKTILWVAENVKSQKKEELYDRVRNADLVLVWSHGGAITFGMAAQNMDLFVRIIKLLKEKSNLNTVVCAVEYRLAPEHPFPAQFEDTTAAYSHLIRKMNVDPKKVIMGGDSAGSLLMPDTIIYNQLYGTILGTSDSLPTPSGYIFSSPVTSTLPNCASEKENRKTDFCPIGVDWVSAYLNSVPKGMNPAPWAFLKETKLAEHSARRVLVIVGGHEIRRDENLLVAETFKNAGVQTTIIQEDYPHNWFCLGDTIVGDPAVMEKANANFALWISQTLTQA